MKKFIAATILAVCLVSPAAQAAESSRDKSAQAPKAERKPKHVPFHGKISAIDKTAKTISLEGKEKQRSLQITSETRIMKEGKPAMLEALAVGEMVNGSYRETSAGKMEVITLNAGGKPANPRHGEKKGESK